MGSHPRVSGFLELLVNGLVGGHDHEDLDHHVEDGHGDQVGDVVPTQQEKSQSLFFMSLANKGKTIQNLLYSSSMGLVVVTAEG